MDGKYTVDHVRIDNKTVKATVRLGNNTVSTSNATAAPSAANIPTPIVVLDISGSMSQNNRFQNSRTFTRMLQQAYGQVELIVYNDDAKNYGLVSTFPIEIDPDYQTHFQAAYDAILTAIEKRSETNGLGTIIFLSDGDDNVSRNAIRDAAVFGKSLCALHAKGKSFTVHSIAVDANEAHVQLLVNLSRCAAIEGSFGTFGTNQNAHRDQHEEEANRLIASIMGNAGAIIVEYMGQKCVLNELQPVSFVFVDDTSINYPDGTVYDQIDYCAYVLSEMASNIANLTIADLVALRERIYKIFVAAGKPPFSTAERKLVRQKLEPLNAVVAQIYEALHAKGKNSHLSNAVISQLNIAARDARSGANNRLVRVAVDRIAKNTTLIEQEDRVITSLVEGGISPSPDETAVLDGMTCILTQCTATELLSEGDCIGVAVRVAAGQMCMFDPTLLSIQGVGVHFIAASEFLHTATHLAAISFDDVTSVYKDPSGVEVSGVLPLFINATHWKIARHHARRMASHLCCKDPLMGTPPILLWTYLQLLSFLQDPNQATAGQKWQELTELVQNTARVIYCENMSVIPKPETFVANVAARLSSAVLSPSALIRAYHQLGLECDTTVVNKYVVEEMMRRQSKEPRRIQQFFMLDRAKYIDPFVKSQVREPRTGHMSLLPGKMAEMIQTVSAEYGSDVVELLHSALGKMVRGEYEVDDTTGEVVDYGEAFDSLDTFEPVALSSACELPAPLSHYSDERKCLILLQTSANLNEADYVSSYHDWHVAPEDLVRSTFVQKVLAHIKLERTAAISQIISNQQNDETSQAVVHLNGENVPLLERVALMHKTCYIGRNVAIFSTTISNRQEEAMLLYGQYDIAPLIGYKGGPVMVKTLMDRNQCGWSPVTSDRHVRRRKTIKKFFI